MPRAVLAIIFLTAALVGQPPAARACSCAAPASPEEALARASAVFSGEVTEITRPLLDRIGLTASGTHEVKFRVIKAWKGVAGPEFVVRTQLTGEACGYTFALGGAYLVFVREILPGIETGICTGTRDLADADAEVRVLDAAIEKRPQP